MIPMAQYLISVLDDTTYTATAEEEEEEEEEEEAAIDDFNEQLRSDGQWVFADGLASPSTATVIDGRGGEAVLTDGPYVETKERSGSEGERYGRNAVEWCRLGDGRR